MRIFLLLLMLFSVGIANAQYSKKDGAIFSIALLQPIDWHPNGNNNSEKIEKVENKYSYVIFFKDYIVITDGSLNEKIKFTKLKKTENHQLYSNDNNEFFVIDNEMTLCSYGKGDKTYFVTNVSLMKTLALMDVLGIISMEK